MVARRMIQNFRPGMLIACALILVSAARAQAEVRITATEGDAVTIEARDATLRDVLDALAKAHKLDFSSSDPLSRRVAGTYSGSLQRVLLRLLYGYNVVMRVSPSGTKLTVVGLSSATQVPAPSVAFARPVGPSSNVDADDEKALERAGVIPRRPSAAAPAAAPARSASHPVPSRPAVSSNVDLDEERSVRDR